MTLISDLLLYFSFNLHFVVIHATYPCYRLVTHAKTLIPKNGISEEHIERIIDETVEAGPLSLTMNRFWDLPIQHVVFGTLKKHRY